MPRFAANLTMMFDEVPFPERFARAAQAGFRAVEFLFPYDYAPVEVAGWLAANALESVLFNLPPGDWAAGDRGLASLPGREEEFRASVRVALEYAAALGTPRMHAMAGLVPEGGDPERHRAVFIENLRYAAREFAKEKRTLLIEPLNEFDLPGYFLNRQAQAQAHAIREAVGEPNLLVQMDLYHVQMSEGGVTAKLRQYIDHVGHVQVAGVPGRHEPDHGEMNSAYLFRQLDELGYAGWVSGEYRPAGRTEDGLGWLRRA